MNREYTNEIEKLKIAGALQAQELLKERRLLAKLHVYLKQGISDMEQCIVRKTDGMPIEEVHTQRASERQETYKDILRIIGTLNECDHEWEPLPFEGRFGCYLSPGGVTSYIHVYHCKKCGERKTERVPMKV